MGEARHRPRLLLEPPQRPELPGAEIEQLRRGGFRTVRREHPVFGNGTFELIESTSDAVLAYLRRNAQETVLCVANTASTARATRLTLAGWSGASVRDVFGGAEFPSVPRDGSYPLTIGARDFYWLVVTR